VENAACHFFVICHGESNTQVGAIAESVERETAGNLNIRPFAVEGMGNAEWVLLDYGNAVVHIFQKPFRSHYKLEELWANGSVTHINELDFASKHERFTSEQ
jgi:ribosome-associated protein